MVHKAMVLKEAVVPKVMGGSIIRVVAKVGKAVVASMDLVSFVMSQDIQRRIAQSLSESWKL